MPSRFPSLPGVSDALALRGVFINMPVLILARISQRTGGDGMQPLVEAILPESFPAR
jgi:hypothetical protein